jgi:5-methylcytosine-specific restriction endonuclease McrA
MHQSLQGATFHFEHVVPLSRGGVTQSDNLAWACPSCNLAKAGRVEGVDTETGMTAPLFNPRLDNWRDHFHWNSYELTAHTAVGRVTLLMLDLNRP